MRRKEIREFIWSILLIGKPIASHLTSLYKVQTNKWIRLWNLRHSNGISKTSISLKGNVYLWIYWVKVMDEVWSLKLTRNSFLSPQFQECTGSKLFHVNLLACRNILSTTFCRRFRKFCKARGKNGVFMKKNCNLRCGCTGKGENKWEFSTWIRDTFLNMFFIFLAV